MGRLEFKVALEELVESAPAVVGHEPFKDFVGPVSYTHLRAHETVLDLVCRLLLEKKKTTTNHHVLELLAQHAKITSKRNVFVM